LRRSCVHVGCDDAARPGGKNCRAHHAATVRRWRKVRRDAGRPTAPSKPASSQGRVALYRSLAYGMLTKGACEACGAASEAVIGLRIGPTPLDVAWACRGCRAAVLKGRADRDAEDRAAAVARAYVLPEAVQRRKSMIDRLDELSPAVAASLRAEAARGPLGMTLSADSPMYRQRLAALVEKRLNAGT